MRRYDVGADTRFAEVMRACGDPTRPGRWITEPIVSAYCALFELGWAQSVEVYRGDELVGGVYGVRIGRFFAGESMFHTATDASKVALVALVERLRAEDALLFDVQWVTEHLASLGAVAVARHEYLERLAAATA
jgi:leucyl/phenylalanyl-tRNA--protein transferase